MSTMYLMNIQYNKINLPAKDSKIEHFSPRKPLSFLGVLISKVTLSCSQYLYDIIQVAFPRYLS